VGLMNEIKDLIEQWKNDGITNPDALEKAYQAILLLIQEVENLKNK
jgi:hypothetical protein